MGVECALIGDALGELLRDRLETLGKHVTLARAQDPDGIHDLRVASRRLRAALREVRPVFEKAPRKALNEQVKAVTRGLGTARELDVSIDLLRKLRPRFRGPARRAATHALHVMDEKRRAATPDVLAAADRVDSEAFHHAVTDLLESRQPGTKCYLDRASKAIRKHDAALRKAHAKWHDSQEDEDLHQTRIAFKKLRYVCESYRNAYGEPMDQFIKDLKGAQEALGQWNDLRVLRDYILESETASDPTVQAGIPELADGLERRMSRLLTQFDRTAGDYLATPADQAILPVLAKPVRQCSKCPHDPPSA